MKIKTVQSLVGLSQKAIRLYEEKGLLQVTRGENGYRDYTQADVERLKQIKTLRFAGVSITDIKLLQEGILSKEELIHKRKQELNQELDTQSEQYELCLRLLQGESYALLEEKNLTETEQEIYPLERVAVGLDIGTTTIAASVVDLIGKRQVETYTVPNSFAVVGENDAYSEQDAEKIFQKLYALLQYIVKEYPSVCSIGVTGQMHGIVYCDENGHAVSNVITWQDKRGELRDFQGQTYCECVEKITGERVATGYGVVTHYYNVRHDIVPKNARCFCSIMDYAVMRLTGNDQPLTHASVAASFGLFDDKNGRFQTKKWQALFGDTRFMPSVVRDFCTCGTYQNIPVAVAIGDNQASFLGAVKHPKNSVHVNIGTGSQISLWSEYTPRKTGVEVRPLGENSYLLCGACLCGGAAYALIEKFFRAYASECGGKRGSQYSLLNALAQKAYDEKEKLPSVCTQFCGTRENANKRGSITGLDEYNFTPSALILGILQGMSEELHDLYLACGEQGRGELIASGGAVRSNPTLLKVLSHVFSMPVFLSGNKEEAGMGAALVSALASKRLRSVDDFADFIEYTSVYTEK